MSKRWRPMMHPFRLPLVLRVSHLVTGPSRELWPTVANCSSSASAHCMHVCCGFKLPQKSKWLLECVMVLLSGTGNSWWVFAACACISCPVGVKESQAKRKMTAASFNTTFDLIHTPWVQSVTSAYGLRSSVCSLFAVWLQFWLLIPA